jgi:biotin synthase
MADIVSAIRRAHPDCAITLSLGERGRDSYRTLFEAGAERYLLRHETANEAHYQSLHPLSMSLANRMQCLYDLRDIGYQVGCGFMVGSPGQTLDCLADDLVFIKALRPQMVGIGPFIPHQDTPFAREIAGTLELTLLLLGILRLMLPDVLLPATTALGTIHPMGRELGILSGANVVMPNLSPVGVRNKYLLYDNKICTGDEAAECRHCMQGRMRGIGYDVTVSRGDCAGFVPKTLTGKNDSDPKEKEEYLCTIQNP